MTDSMKQTAIIGTILVLGFASLIVHRTWESKNQNRTEACIMYEGYVEDANVVRRQFECKLNDPSGSLDSWKGFHERHDGIRAQGKTWRASSVYAEYMSYKSLSWAHSQLLTMAYEMRTNPEAASKARSEARDSMKEVEKYLGSESELRQAGAVD